MQASISENYPLYRPTQKYGKPEIGHHPVAGDGESNRMKWPPEEAKLKEHKRQRKDQACGGEGQRSIVRPGKVIQPIGQDRGGVVGDPRCDSAIDPEIHVEGSPKS